MLRSQEDFREQDNLGPTVQDAPRRADGAGGGINADMLDGQHGAYYVARANHTGTQAISTVTGLQTALDAKLDDSQAGTFGLSFLATATLGDAKTLLASSVALFDHYATVGNGTTVETDLYSDTIAAAQLGANGAKLAAEYGGNFVSSATATRQIRIYFAGTMIFDTGALTLSLSSAWTVYVSIIRVSASVVRYMISFTTEGAALSAYTAVGELTGLTLANTAVLKITGQAAGVGAATNDILAKLGSVAYAPAA